MSSSSRQKRRSPGSRPTDEQLMDAALRVFAQAGFMPATMDAIAEEADCTKPTLYAHFGAKETLFEAVVQREIGALGERLRSSYALAEGARPREQIRITVGAFFDYAASSPAGFRLLFGETNAITTPTGHELLNAATDGLARLIQGAVPRPEVTRTANLIAAMGVGVCIRGAYQALHDGHDLELAGRLASAYIEAADTGLDVSLLSEFDAG